MNKEVQEEEINKLVKLPPIILNLLCELLAIVVFIQPVIESLFLSLGLIVMKL